MVRDLEVYGLPSGDRVLLKDGAGCITAPAGTVVDLLEDGVKLTLRGLL